MIFIPEGNSTPNFLHSVLIIISLPSRTMWHIPVSKAAAAPVIIRGSLPSLMTIVGF